MTYEEAKRRARKEFGTNGHAWTERVGIKMFPRRYLVGTFIVNAITLKKVLAILGVGTSWEEAFATAAKLGWKNGEMP